MTTRFGVFVPQGWRMDLAEIEDPIEQFETMTRVARAADEGGWDSIWVFDHFHTVPTPELETCFEAWTISATLARDTQNVKIGQMVGCNGYRNPALYAKMASTVDVASHGRLYAGIGAGWYEHEWRAYGYGFPELRDRMGMFREACEIIHRMWTEDYPRFEGKYYAIDAPINEPKGVRKPHPSFWIGGGGERVTLKLVARWGDACNVAGSVPGDVDTIRHKLDVLKRHCDDLGRDYDEIIKSTSVSIHVVDDMNEAERATADARGDRSFDDYATGTIVGTPEMVRERLQPVIDAGIDYFIVTIPREAYDQDAVRRFARDDGVGCCVSIDYLTRPVEVLREVGRVLKVGSPTIISFSNRCFPDKAVAIWHQLDDQGHVRLVKEYLREAGNFENVRGLDRSPRRLFSDPLYAVIGESVGPYTKEGGI